MPLFDYVAIDPAGDVRRGTMEAADEAGLIARLQRDGFTPTRAVPATGRPRLAGLLSMEIGKGALSAGDRVDLARELATMLEAGQDLDRALRFVVETAANRRRRLVMGRVRDKVRGGAALADALEGEPASFPPFMVGLVRAGEAGGTLGDTFRRLAEALERQRSLAAQVRSALLYPAVLVATAIASIVFLVAFVLPGFVPMFTDNGVPVPTSVAFLVAAGHVFADDWPLMLAALAAIVVGGRLALADPRRRLVADRLLLRLPVVGTLVSEALAARFARAFGTLLANGVPLIRALSIAKGTIGNRAAIAAIGAASEAASQGESLARALGEAGVFPGHLIQLLRLGEETARLAATAIKASEIHEERLGARVQRLVSLLVPAVTLVMGALVAGIVATLVSAMLSINDLAL